MRFFTDPSIVDPSLPIDTVCENLLGMLSALLGVELTFALGCAAGRGKRPRPNAHAAPRPRLGAARRARDGVGQVQRGRAARQAVGKIRQEQEELVEQTEAAVRIQSTWRLQLAVLRLHEEREARVLNAWLATASYAHQPKSRALGAWSSLGPTSAAPGRR